MPELNELMEDSEEPSNSPPDSCPPPSSPAPPIGSAALESRLLGRIDMYERALHRASAEGEKSRTRRYGRGLSTLKTMLASVKRGKPIKEEEIPPPVATGIVVPDRQGPAPITEQEFENRPPPASALTSEGHSQDVEATSQPGLDHSVKELLLGRQRGYMLAAVQAKRSGDMDLARRYYLTAKKLDWTLEASETGDLVDISFLPPPPDIPNHQNVESEPIAHSTTDKPPAPPTTVSGDVPREVHAPCQAPLSDQYSQLIEVLTQQQQRSLGFCQQFTHMGKITETTRFEGLAEDCVRQLEVLRQLQSRGQPLPRYHTEQRTFTVYRIIPSLADSDMVLTIVRGVNLPVPTGLSLADLDVSVRFEFPLPSLEEAQRDQTRSVQNNICPEFNEHFKLHIKRGRRAFKRVIQSKSIKLEVVHKGGLFKTDKVLGSAALKLDTLETHCEIRQLIQVQNRRRATGAHLEVEVRVREPLGGPQQDTVTERWLSLDPLSLPAPATTKHTAGTQHRYKAHSSSSVCLVL